MKYFAACLLWIWVTLPVSMQDVPEPTPEPEPDASIAGLIEANFTADSFSPLVGEPVKLSLVVEVPPELVLVEWPEIPVDWSPFDVRSAGEIEVDEQPDGTIIYRQEFTVILWEPGDYETPETFIGYQTPDNDEIYRVPISIAFFQVPSVLDDQDMANDEQQLRPARPPISLFYVPPWAVLLGIVVLSGALWTGYRRLERWRLERAARRAAMQQPTPGEIALQTLVQLRNNGTHPDEVYVRVADSLRTYVHHQLDVPAPDMTTLELMAHLQSVNVLSEGRRAELRRLLEQADLVKFANAQPGEQSASRVLNLAYRWLSGVDQSMMIDKGGEST